MPVDVGAHHPLQRSAVMRRARRRHRFEDQQHPPRQVLIGVLVESDPASQLGNVDGGAERALAAGFGAVPRHDRGEVIEVCGDRRARHFRIERELCARHRDRFFGRRALTSRVDQQPVEIGDAGHLRTPPRTEQDDARLVGQADLAVQLASELAKLRFAVGARGEQRRKAGGAARRKVLERAEGPRASAVRHARQPARRGAATAERALSQWSFEDPRHVAAALK